MPLGSGRVDDLGSGQMISGSGQGSGSKLNCAARARVGSDDLGFGSGSGSKLNCPARVGSGQMISGSGFSRPLSLTHKGLDLGIVDI